MKSDIKRLVKRSTLVFWRFGWFLETAYRRFLMLKPVLEEQARRRKKPCPQLWMR